MWLPEEDVLKRFQLVSTSVAAIAVPIIVALAAWIVQSRIAEESARKDYVQIAVSVLSQPSSKDNAELRHWAVEVLKNNSPVPFGPKVESQLAATGFFGAITGDNDALREYLDKRLSATDKPMFHQQEWRDPWSDALLRFYETPAGKKSLRDFSDFLSSPATPSSSSGNPGVGGEPPHPPSSSQYRPRGQQ